MLALVIMIDLGKAIDRRRDNCELIFRHGHRRQR